MGQMQRDHTGHIAEDVYCIHCGFNLRGFDPMRECVGCGEPVADSASDTRLRFCSPEWLGQLLSGVDWLLGWLATSVVALVLYIVVVLAFVVPGVVYTAQASATNQPATEAIAPESSEAMPTAETAGTAGWTHWIRLLLLLPGVVAMVGVWKLTIPEPEPGPGPGPSEVARHVARLALVGGYALHLAHWITSPFSSNAWIPQISLLLVAALMGAGVFALLGYLAHLVRRLPAKGLARQSRFVQWGLSGVVLLLLIHAGTILYQQHLEGQLEPGRSLGLAYDQPFSQPWQTFSSCGLTLGLTVCAIVGVALIFHHRLAFAEALRQAKERQQRLQPRNLAG